MAELEILSPAGSPESLEAALRCGATAVYIGGEKFSARNNAHNFTIEQIQSAVRDCHLYNAKLYIAVNTVITDSEASDFCEFIKETAKLGVDAYIIQDLGAASLIKKCVPDAILHGSTQMSVHSRKGAELLKDLGFKRVVASRELNDKQIREISSAGIEVEAFVHGALCASVSGQCYISALIGSRSANRGNCAGTCRLPFTARESCEKSGYCGLSLKDLSLLNHVKRLAECGVCSLKIEGRMKRPEYVASAVTALKQAVTGESPDLETLRSIFSRDGFTDGWFTDKPDDMFGTRNRDDIVSGTELIPKIRETYRKVPKKYTADFRIEIKRDKPVTLSVSYLNLNVTVEGAIPETAINRPIDAFHLERQLSKLGDTVFEYGTGDFVIEERLTVSASQINELRRLAIKKLSEKVIAERTLVYNITDFRPFVNSSGQILMKKFFRFHCQTLKQAEIALFSSDLIILSMEHCGKADFKDRLIIDPPRFISDEKEITVKLKTLFENGVTRLLCTNLAYIKIGKEIGFKLHGGFGLNIANSFFPDLGLEDCIASFELKNTQINSLELPIPKGVILHGRLPVMLLKNCPIKHEIGCQNCRKIITDRTGREFRVRCHGNYVELLNADILYTADRLREFSYDYGVIMLDEFMSDSEADNIIWQYSGGKIEKPEFFTRGLYYRGVE